MTRIINTTLAILLFLTCSYTASAQAEVEMADSMRSEGKIYVVVAILLLILVGLVGYLVLIDRKISRLEKRIPDKKS